MDLKDFVKETLIQITAGVKESQQEIRRSGGYASPVMRWVQKGGGGPAHFGDVESGHPVFLVDFDVAVTVVEEKGTNAQAKLQVASLLKLGAGGESSSSNTATSKISFKVPLALPVDQDSKDLADERDRETERAMRQTTPGSYY